MSIEKQQMPALHPVYARLLCAELQRQGLSTAEIVGNTGLNWASLHDQSDWLSINQMQALVSRAVELSKNATLGMTVGLNTQVTAHGALGSAVASCATLADALMLIERYAVLRQSIVHTKTITQGQFAGLIVHEHYMPEPLRQYLLLQLVAGLLRLVDTVTGMSMATALRIEWPFPRPIWSDQLKAIAADNSFSADKLTVLLPASVITLPSLAADAHTYELSVLECERQAQALQHGGKWSQRVKTYLAQHLLHAPSLANTAEAFNMSSRSLARRLQQESTRYQQLIDAVRFDATCAKLRLNSQPINTIAMAVGFQDASNFSRTFMRWAGMTPREYRLQYCPDTATKTALKEPI